MTDKDKKVLDLIQRFGGFDGAHHKQWVLDQIVRILTDCPTHFGIARDCKGRPYQSKTLGESETYKEWVLDHMDGEDGPHTYDWDTGIIP